MQSEIFVECVTMLKKDKLNRLKHWYEIKMEGPPVPKYLSGKQTLKVKK